MSSRTDGVGLGAARLGLPAGFAHFRPPVRPRRPIRRGGVMVERLGHEKHEPTGSNGGQGGHEFGCQWRPDYALRARPLYGFKNTFWFGLATQNWGGRMLPVVTQFGGRCVAEEMKND